MNYKELLDKTAKQLELSIELNNGVEIPTEEFGWYNKRYISDDFRVAHVERYSDNNLEVLHFTCFPTEWSQNPIFGFDIITTEKKCLAAFLDWSPVDNNITYKTTYNFSTPYNLPDWAKIIFSKDAIAVVPNDEEFVLLCSIVLESFDEYISILKSSKLTSSRIQYIIGSQNRYCHQQQKNERTFNVLKSKLGEERARYFMTRILFPTIHETLD